MLEQARKDLVKLRQEGVTVLQIKDGLSVAQYFANALSQRYAQLKPKALAIP